MPQTAIGYFTLIESKYILPGRSQPRRDFNGEALFELSDSIKKHGLLQPVSVRSCAEFPGKYEIIAGERRFRACVLAGMTEIPCLVIGADDRSAAELAIIENTQRRDLGMFEEAAAIYALEETGMTREELSSRLSINRSTLSNKLRLLRFTISERERIVAAKLTERHCRALLRLEDPALRARALKYMETARPSVAKAEEYVECLLADPQNAKNKPRHKSVGTVKDMRIIVNTVTRALRPLGKKIECETEETDEEYRIITRIPK